MPTPIFLDTRTADLATAKGHTADAASAAVDNLLTDRRSEFARSSGDVTTFFCNFELDVSTTINAMALFDVIGPLTVETKVQFRGASSEANLTASPTFDSTATIIPVTADGVRHAVWYSETGYSVAFVRVDVTFTGTAQVLGASRVMFGGAWAPERKVQYGSGLVTPGSRTEVIETDSGGQFLRHLSRRRAAEPGLVLTEDEYGDDIWEIYAYAGTNRPLMYCQDASVWQSDPEYASKQLLYGRIVDTGMVTAEGYDYHVVSIPLEEYT